VIGCDETFGLGSGSPFKPGSAALCKLHNRLALSTDADDVYLAYQGCPLRLVGILVAGKGSIDRVIAFCSTTPGPDRTGSDDWYRNVLLQLDIAAAIASRPETAREVAGTGWLGYVGCGDQPVPPWLYGIACIPLTRTWDGAFVRPTPFCPELFGRMAAQPQAMRWIADRTFAAPRTTGCR
jgi:hypothetical protein